MHRLIYTNVISRKILPLLAFALFCVEGSAGLSGCMQSPLGDANLTRNTYLELVDWHISGLWIINCPVAWLRIANYNSVPIKNIVFQYNTYDAAGHPLDQGTYTVEDTVGAGVVKNIIEQYLGLVNLHSEKLSVKLLSVSPG